jgi:SAM-dependent methyltransferase
MMRRVQSLVMPLVTPAFWRATLAVREARAFDRRYGTDTVRRLPVEAMRDVPGELARHAVHYEASAIPKFRSGVRAVRRTLGPRLPQTSFVDVGSGKGLVVMLASQLAFREVVGIEMAPELHDIAERNSDRFRAAGAARAPMRLVLGDALRADLPAGDLVVYLYNPFDAILIGRFLERLDEAAADGRDLLLVYVNPLHRAQLDAAGRYQELFDNGSVAVFRRRRSAVS